MNEFLITDVDEILKKYFISISTEFNKINNNMFIIPTGFGDFRATNGYGTNLGLYDLLAGRANHRMLYINKEFYYDTNNTDHKIFKSSSIIFEDVIKIIYDKFEVIGRFKI